MNSLRVMIMVIAMMLGLANVMKGFTVTIAQVNFQTCNCGLLTKTYLLNIKFSLNLVNLFFWCLTDAMAYFGIFLCRWFFWKRIFYRSFVGVRPSKLIDPNLTPLGRSCGRCDQLERWKTSNLTVFEGKKIRQAPNRIFHSCCDAKILMNSALMCHF